jgi:hypothetical protein
MAGMRMVVSNPGPVPVTIDRKGRQLGGGDFAVVDDGDRTTAAALAAGNIGQVERPADLDEEHVQLGALEAFAELDAGDAEKADAEEPAAEASAQTSSRRHGGGARQRSEA